MSFSNILKIIGIIAIIVCISMVYNRFNPKPSYDLSNGLSLPKGTVSAISVKKASTTVIGVDKVVRIVRPRMGETKIEVRDEGSLKIFNPFPVQVGSVCHIGALYIGRLEPAVGIQFFRVNPLKLGLSAELSPSLLGISCTRDILDTGNIGIGLGIDKEGLQRAFLVFSVNF